MRVKILRATYARGYLDELDCEEVEVTGDLGEHAQAMADEHEHARMTEDEDEEDAPDQPEEACGEAIASGNGAYGFFTGEDTVTYLIPEGHPNFDLDYTTTDWWTEEAIERWAENLGDCR